MSQVLAPDVERQLEQHRDALAGYCYRMLGSAFEAQDAVQEVMVSAWRNHDRFEGRSSLRTWLFSIATNVCLNMLAGRERRALPMDLTDPVAGHTALGPPREPDVWVEPFPDPAESTVARETVRLAFVAALQHLPPRQRAVLILRDVLGWKASEVADLLGSTRVSVNSALQRARATLAAAEDPAAPPAERSRVTDDEQQALLARYVDAFERFDIALLVELLHEDATLSMPPFELWVRGRSAIRDWFGQSDGSCRAQRFVPAAAANGSPAFGLYRPTGPGGRYDGFGLQVVEVSGPAITAIHTFLDPRLFPLFELPPSL